MKKTISVFLTILILSLGSAPAKAQETTSERSISDNIYLGVQTGMPMSVADFSSFATDRFRPGWTAGLFGGYRFDSLWSVELTASWGKLFMAERDCCYDRDYFLGTDGNRYKFVPEGMEGKYYKDLESNIFVQRYGVQANVNVLDLFARTRNSLWKAEVSPALYAVGTATDILLKADKSIYVGDIDKWHLGLGINAQASYNLTNSLALGVYTGFTHLTGQPMDGMPVLHVTNCIIDAGIRLILNFGEEKKRTQRAAALVYVPQPVVRPEPVAEPQPVIEQEPEEVPEPVVETVPAVEVEQEVEPETVSEPVVEPEVVPEVEPVPSKYPVIYFSFNSFWIEPSERMKIKEIADIMKADKSIRILVRAWGDPAGGEAPNERISLMRAERVKQVLGQWLIPADRIEVEGCGIKHDAPDDTEARIAVITEIQQ